MRIQEVLVGLLAILTTFGLPQTSHQSEATIYASIIGVWRAEMDGLPSITLTITNETGNLSGAILFYLHRRDEGQRWTSMPGIPEPLFNPKFDGKILTFEVSHRRAHPPRTLLDPPVHFRMTLTGPDKAELVNENEGRGSGFPIVRDE
jgi:hypothetical protein